MSRRIGGGYVIYHGADPAISPPVSKPKAREMMSLPQDKMISVAIGFSTATKGWDILSKIDMPNGWTMVLNSSKGHFNREQNLAYDNLERRKRRNPNNGNTELKSLIYRRVFSQKRNSLCYFMPLMLWCCLTK